MSRQETKRRGHAGSMRHAPPHVKPRKQAGVFEQKNGCCIGAGEGKDEELNDFILCLGYPLDHSRKPLPGKKADGEELNDFILCLGYGSERAWKSIGSEVGRD